MKPRDFRVSVTINENGSAADSKRIRKAAGRLLDGMRRTIETVCRYADKAGEGKAVKK